MPPRRLTQGGPSQPRRRRNDSDGDEDSGGSEHEERDDAGSATTSVSKQAAQLVRFALIYEYKRKFLTRAEILKEIGKGYKLHFDEVLREANTMLQTTFGMELIELRAKGAANTVGETQAPSAQTQNSNGKEKEKEKEKGKGKGKGRAGRGDEEDADSSSSSEEEESTAAAAGATQKRQRIARSNTYVLRSTLPATLIAKMNRPLPLPTANGVNNDDRRRVEDEAADSGALLRWEKADASSSGHIALIGIRSIILSLILCMGRVIQNDYLHTLLARINLQADTELPYSPPDGSKGTYFTLDKYLDHLAAKGYLEKTKLNGPNLETTQYEWRWGHKAIDFSEKSAAIFIERIFYGVEGDEADVPVENNERSVARNGRANGNGNGNGNRAGQARNEATREEEIRQDRESLRANLIKAAGGPLAGDV